MLLDGIITESQLDAWVRGNAQIAQGVIVELTRRLVAAASPNPKECRFQFPDSIGQPGPDGVLDTEFGYEPFVPEGRSYWEIGTGLDARAKATSDYKDSVKDIPEITRQQSTFIFVTPLSGRRGWKYTWKDNGQIKWLEERRKRNDWLDVRIIDGTGLIDWLHRFPAVEAWLATKMGLPAQQIQTLEQRWAELRTIGDPPPLTPHLFLTNRDEACSKIKEVFSGAVLQLQLDTHYPNHVADFVAAYVAQMDEDNQIDAISRCLIISDADTWNTITAFRERHVLIADFNLVEDDARGTKLLEKARRAGHTAIIGGQPGGIPHSHRVSIPDPNIYQIQEALEKAGYKEERARILAQKSGGNINSLLRCLQNLSLMPEWAQSTDAAELAIVELLGSWKESVDADRIIVENLSGNSYGEWIGKIREIAFRPGTPLTHQEGIWKFVARYEGWSALGPRLFDEHLDRFKAAAIEVLIERDPKFELPPEERFAANIRGKVLSHSQNLRKGLAESLALLGSHPDALTSCSIGKAEDTAILAVREILADADWVLWASLNDLLPLLAEAAPGEFLNAVEKALDSNPCPFDTLFAQEGSGVTGTTYMSGTLWALETLAWDPTYLLRVVNHLGELAARDPGGNWENRPANSLTAILLPWLPQTCAPISKRRVAVETLIRERPQEAWKLLVSLLPQPHQFSSGSRKPEWRDIIPGDWPKSVTHHEYWEQIGIYAELAVSMAKGDIKRLTDLIKHFDRLPSLAQEQILAHLDSTEIITLSETEKFPLWAAIISLVMKHRQFADADWAMKPELVNKIDSAAKKIAPDSPTLRHRQLFSEQALELFEDESNFEEQEKKLDEVRQQAVDEIYRSAGISGVFEFAEDVESPWYVGTGLGAIAEDRIDNKVLPDLLETEARSLVQFAGGFIRGRFRTRGWPWVNMLELTNWTPSQIGQFLAYLPFASETWKLVSALLGEDESPYWSRANATLHDVDAELDYGLNQLVQHNRPLVAIRCIFGLKHQKKPINPDLTIRALIAAVNSKESTGSWDIHVIIELIKALQENPDVSPDDLFNVEWAYLPLFEHRRDASPKFLERRLADEPGFFCEVIRLIYRSKKAKSAERTPTEQEKTIATNAYRLLNNWKTPPGYQKDGSVDGNALAAWLDTVKTECRETGHFEVAMAMVGQVFIHTPPDPDGLWIHHSVAEALNKKDAQNMRNGFRTALYNSRGVHFSSAGKEEMALAEKYRTKAEEVEAHGYHRLADSLRELAGSYERDAEWESKGGLFGD